MSRRKLNKALGLAQDARQHMRRHGWVEIDIEPVSGHDDAVRVSFDLPSNPRMRAFGLYSVRGFSSGTAGELIDERGFPKDDWDEMSFWSERVWLLACAQFAVGDGDLRRLHIEDDAYARSIGYPPKRSLGTSRSLSAAVSPTHELSEATLQTVERLRSKMLDSNWAEGGYYPAEYDGDQTSLTFKYERPPLIAIVILPADGSFSGYLKTQVDEEWLTHQFDHEDTWFRACVSGTGVLSEVDPEVVEQEWRAILVQAQPLREIMTSRGWIEADAYHQPPDGVFNFEHPDQPDLCATAWIQDVGFSFGNAGMSDADDYFMTTEESWLELCAEELARVEEYDEEEGVPDNPTPAGADPIETIERLHRLHEAGAITAEEFEAKRRDLLDRI